MADLKTIEDLELPDSHGAPTRLGDLWAQQPTIVVWLRHYG